MLARNLPGICSAFARSLLGTRSSLGICSEFALKTVRTSHARNSATQISHPEPARCEGSLGDLFLDREQPAADKSHNLRGWQRMGAQKGGFENTLERP